MQTQEETSARVFRQCKRPSRLQAVQAPRWEAMLVRRRKPLNASTMLCTVGERPGRMQVTGQVSRAAAKLRAARRDLTRLTRALSVTNRHDRPPVNGAASPSRSSAFGAAQRLCRRLTPDLASASLLPPHHHPCATPLRHPSCNGAFAHAARTGSPGLLLGPAARAAFAAAVGRAQRAARAARRRARALHALDHLVSLLSCEWRSRRAPCGTSGPGRCAHPQAGARGTESARHGAPTRSLPSTRFHVFVGPMAEPEALVAPQVQHPADPPSVVSRFFRSWAAQPLLNGGQVRRGGRGGAAAQLGTWHACPRPVAPVAGAADAAERRRRGSARARQPGSRTLPKCTRPPTPSSIPSPPRRPAGRGRLPLHQRLPHRPHLGGGGRQDRRVQVRTREGLGAASPRLRALDAAQCAPLAAGPPAPAHLRTRPPATTPRPRHPPPRFGRFLGRRLLRVWPTLALALGIIAVGSRLAAGSDPTAAVAADACARDWWKVGAGGGPHAPTRRAPPAHCCVPAGALQPDGVRPPESDRPPDGPALPHLCAPSRCCCCSTMCCAPSAWA